MALIHEKIIAAMNDIGAIGKDSRNAQQGFQYRGIDAVYNTLNPIMAKHGLFICPEVLGMNREERTNAKGTVLIYTALTMKYTIYAQDGSNVSCVVVGEGMDTGDKSANKAMSIAMKYAMFQLFFIPTEELKDPDAECHTDILPKQSKAPVTVSAPANATVSVVNQVPQLPKAEEPKVEISPVKQFLLTAMGGLREKRGISPSENNKLFKKQHEVLIANKLAPNKKADEYTMEEATALIAAMESCFDLTGTELKTE